MPTLKQQEKERKKERKKARKKESKKAKYFVQQKKKAAFWYISYSGKKEAEVDSN